MSAESQWGYAASAWKTIRSRWGLALLLIVIDAAFIAAIMLLDFGWAALGAWWGVSRGFVDAVSVLFLAAYFLIAWLFISAVKQAHLNAASRMVATKPARLRFVRTLGFCAIAFALFLISYFGLGSVYTLAGAASPWRIALFILFLIVAAFLVFWIMPAQMMLSQGAKVKGAYTAGLRTFRRPRRQLFILLGFVAVQLVILLLYQLAAAILRANHATDQAAFEAAYPSFVYISAIAMVVIDYLFFYLVRLMLYAQALTEVHGGHATIERAQPKKT